LTVLFYMHCLSQCYRIRFTQNFTNFYFSYLILISILVTPLVFEHKSRRRFEYLSIYTTSVTIHPLLRPFERKLL